VNPANLDHQNLISALPARFTFISIVQHFAFESLALLFGNDFSLAIGVQRRRRKNLQDHLVGFSKSQIFQQSDK
jgi:hypothetical protein